MPRSGPPTSSVPRTTTRRGKSRKEQAEYIWPTLTSAEHFITLELNASQFERYTDYLTTDDLCKLIVLPRTKTAEGVSQSYCELLDAEWRASGGASGSPLANATQFVSHAWKYDIATVAATLREWVDGDESPDDAETSCRFWFDNFVLDQHAAAAGKFTSKFWFDGFSDAIKAMGHTLPILMPWRSAIPLTRAWCVYEIAETARVDAQRTFLLPKRERDDMLRELVDEFETMAKVIAGVALQDAEGGAEDRKQIMAIAEEVGMSDLNGLVCAALREWLAGDGEGGAGAEGRGGGG